MENPEKRDHQDDSMKVRALQKSALQHFARIAEETIGVQTPEGKEVGVKHLQTVLLRELESEKAQADKIYDEYLQRKKAGETLASPSSDLYEIYHSYRQKLGTLMDKVKEVNSIGNIANMAPQPLNLNAHSALALGRFFVPTLSSMLHQETANEDSP